MGAVRIATIGTSGICEQFCRAVADVEGVEVVASYSRDLGRAHEFGARFGATTFFDGLSELARSPEIDAVYIASPNGAHAAQAAQMIAGGKHVLVEKALASNEREARSVFDAARAADVVAMEALRTLHVPSFRRIEEIVSADLGQVRLATLRFAKVTSRIARLRAGERINIFDPALAGGALMDIGIYCVEPAVALFGRPAEVRALGVTAPVPGCEPGDPCSTIDLAGEALLGYGDKVVQVSYGKVCDDVLSSQVEGEGGTLVWDATSCPVNLRLHRPEGGGQVFRMGEASLEPVPVDVPERDMACEISDFVSAVRGEAQGLALRERCERVTLDSLAVMDEIRRQVGVVFPADLA